MADAALRLLIRLEQLKDVYGDGAAARKLSLLEELARRPLARARDVARLHEMLCFLRAYPDDAAILARVEAMLEAFAARRDLRRRRTVLADSGIAGTAIRFPFFFATAVWLARRHPDRLTLDWERWGKSTELEGWLHLLLPYTETLIVDAYTYPAREWLRRLRARGETDAAFLVRRFAALTADSFGRETVYEHLAIPLVLSPGPRTPSRTRAKFAASRYVGRRVAYQKVSLDRGRPDLKRDVLRPPRGVRFVSPGEGQKLIDLAREAMVTRARDLDVFIHADQQDVRIYDCGKGLEFACMGVVPERRLMLESVYGFLTLKNGVPIGYVLASGLFRSSEVAYNVFETYRGAEAARIYGRALAVVRQLFGSDTFTIDPYQLGHGNEEGLESGAWWFYYKLGFRPHDPKVRGLVRRELARMRVRPSYRSSLTTLDRLSAGNLFLHLGKPRRDVLGHLDLGQFGLRVSRYLADRFGADRERGLRICAREAAALLGVRSFRGWSAGERLWWGRWAPLFMMMPGAKSWSAGERRALVEIVRAKGGRREAESVTRLAGGEVLRRILRRERNSEDGL